MNNIVMLQVRFCYFIINSKKITLTSKSKIHQSKSTTFIRPRVSYKHTKYAPSDPICLVKHYIVFTEGVMTFSFLNLLFLLWDCLTIIACPAPSHVDATSFTSARWTSKKIFGYKELTRDRRRCCWRANRLGGWLAGQMFVKRRVNGM